jgi:hypothetical protein
VKRDQVAFVLVAIGLMRMGDYCGVVEQGLQ